jgi:protein TonB
MEALKSKKADLENKRSLFFQIGLIVSLIAVFMAFEYKSYEELILPGIYRQMDNTIEETVPITVHEQKPLPIPPVPAASITVVDNLVETPEAPTIDVTANQETETPTIPDIPFEEPVIIDDTPFVVVEQMPEFPGGLNELYRYIGKNINYPQVAKEVGIQGTVFVKFIIERDGSISNVELLRSIGGGCDEEAMRVIQAMPSWSAGLQLGKPVRVSYNLPVKFTLH